MKTTVEIEWDEPKEQAWLCADNIAVALHAHCPNTKFVVREVLTGEEAEELAALAAGKLGW